MKSLALLALPLWLAACAGGGDPTAACNTLCTDAGFTGGTADVQPNEVNCFCDGEGGPLTADACGSTCTGLGWAGGEAFDVDACQCSND